MVPGRTLSKLSVYGKRSEDNTYVCRYCGKDSMQGRSALIVHAENEHPIEAHEAWQMAIEKQRRRLEFVRIPKPVGSAKKETCPHYTAAETALLYRLYIENFEAYHTRTQYGSRNVLTQRAELLKAWGAELTALGVAKRHPDKIADKLKKDMHLAKSLVTKYKQQTGELFSWPPPPHYRDTHPNLEPLFGVIEGACTVKTVVLFDSSIYGTNAESQSSSCQEPAVKVKEEVEEPFVHTETIFDILMERGKLASDVPADGEPVAKQRKTSDSPTTSQDAPSFSPESNRTSRDSADACHGDLELVDKQHQQLELEMRVIGEKFRKKSDLAPPNEGSQSTSKLNPTAGGGKTYDESELIKKKMEKVELEMRLMGEKHRLEMELIRIQIENAKRNTGSREGNWAPPGIATYSHT